MFQYPSQFYILSDKDARLRRKRSNAIEPNSPICCETHHCPLRFPIKCGYFVPFRHKTCKIPGIITPKL